MITHTPVRKLGLGTIQRAEPRSETRPRRELTAAESALVLLLPSSTPLRACFLVRRRLPRHGPTVVARATASNTAPAPRMSAPMETRPRACAPAARGRAHRAGVPRAQAVTRSFRRVSLCSSSAPALTLHRVRGNVGLLTAQRAIDGARAPPLILCAADH